MLFILLLVVLTVIFLVAEPIFLGPSSLITLCLVCFIFLPAARYCDWSKIEQYYAVKSTIEASRLDGNELERAAMINEIIDVNKDIARAKYWDDSWWFGCFIVDEYAELEPLR